MGFEATAVETRKGRVTRMEPGGVRRTVVYRVGSGGRGPGIVATVVGLACIGGLAVLGLLTAVVLLWIALGLVAAGVVLAVVRAVLGAGDKPGDGRRG